MAQVNQYIYYQNKASGEFLGQYSPIFLSYKSKGNLASALDQFFIQQTFMHLPK